MEKNKYNSERRGDVFLVLVPHRDTRVLVRKYSDALAGTGLTGWYTFPWVAPLAVLSQPLCDEELKKCAHSLREIIGGNKIFTAEISGTKFSAGTEEMALFGPRLDLSITGKDLGETILKIKNLFSPFVIGTYLLPVVRSGVSQDSGENQMMQPNAPIPQCEKLGFRAAAVANMFWRQFKTGSQKYFKWKIGKLFWLPHPADRH